MKIMSTKTLASLRNHWRMKRALIGAVCGLGLLSGTAIAQPLQLDLGSGTDSLATNAQTGWTKLLQSGASVTGPGAYYQWNNVGGTSYTLIMTNVNNYGSAAGPLNNDGFYNNGSTAFFVLSNLPAGNTVALYGCAAWDGTGRGGQFIYGGVTNTLNTLGAMPVPSVSTLQYLGRATVAGDGTIRGDWYGPGNFPGAITAQGQVGALIFDVEPCQPIITIVGNNPMLVPVNSTFTDPGATAVESCSGSAVAVTTNGTVDATTIGTYTITYTAIADGITNTATRTVNVVLSDFVNLDLGPSGSSVPTPAGFTKLARTGNNMSFSVTSVGSKNYTLLFTNVGNAYSAGGSTLDKDGFIATSGNTAGFALSNLVAGSQVTLYACWGWDGLSHAPTFIFGGATNKLNVGTGITAPSITTLMNVGTAVADGTGVVSGTWTYISSAEGQVGGMIFGIQAPVGHNITILPTGVTNGCGSTATFVAAAPGGANYQWYNNLGAPITGATNITLVLTNLHPSASGNYNFIATATNASWTATNSAVVSIYDIAPPVMTMNGNSVMTISINSTWTDPGVTAYDTCAGNYLTVTTNGTVNTSVAGQYNLTYSAITGDGVSNSVARSVYVIDPAAILPDVQLALDYQSTSDNWGTAAGFTALKLFDFNATPPTYGNASVTNPTGTSSSLVLSFTNISSWDQSDYLGYSTISTAGIYNYNLTPATFTLSGLPTNVVVNIYAVYGWNAATHAAQIIYAGKTNLLTTGITYSSPNPPTTADFQFIGSALANNGTVSGTWYGPTGPASEGQIGGMIINIQSYPAHSAVVSPASVTPQCGSNVTFTASASGGGTFTYQWYDNNTNLIAGATNATYTLVNVRATSAGNYTAIVGNAYGSATNFATVTGVFDSQPPIMALSGPSTLNILVNSTYVDAGASAYDLCAQASLPMTTNSTVNTASIGSYTVTYSAMTASGTPGQIVRTVNVTDVPNLSLNLDLGTTDAANPPAPAGYTLLAVGGSSTTAVNTSTFANVAGSIYSLTVSNFSQYNLNNTNEPLTTCAFYMNARNNNNNNTNPVGFVLNGIQPTLKVSLYAIYGQDGPGPSAADVFFGGTSAQIISHGDPGQTPSLTNFTRIGSAMVGSSGAVSGYWTGPGGSLTTAGEVGGMVFVVGTNTPPAASNLVMNAVGAHPATLQIVGNAAGPTDPDGDPLTLTAVQTNIGSVTIISNSVIYTAPSAYSGVDTFNYTVSDGFGGISTGTVTVTVTPNSPPAVSAISMNATNGLLATLKIIGGANAPTDANGDAMLVTAVQNPSDNGGTVAIVSGGTNVTYVSSYVGTDHFTYTVGDGHGGFSTATVTVSVADTNHPPVASNMVMNAVGAHSATLLIVGNPSGPTDPDGDPLTLTAVQTNIGSVGLVVISGNSAIYTAPSTYNGVDTFNYTVSDGRGGISTGTVTVSVTANSPPAVSPISMNATNSQPATLQIIGGANAPTDANGDTLLVTAVQNPSDQGGTVTTDGTNVTYVASYVGTDHFTYTVSDGHGGFSTATVTVSVADTNQPPVAGPQVMGAVSGQAATLKIIGGANPPSDPDGDLVTVTSVNTAANGTAGTDGTNVTYTSANGFTGSDTFNYVVGDGRGGFATNTVTVSVVSATGYNRLASPVRSGGNYNVSFNGIPYVNYVLLNTTNLVPPVTWSPVVTNQADANTGVITFTFTPSSSKGFYKTGSLP